MKKISAILIGTLVVSTLLVAGCNTVQGIGKDVQQGGRDIQRAAN